MAQVEIKRDFKVLKEEISPQNVLVMAELFAISETKKLMRFAGEFALKIHQRLCCDVFNKDAEGYVLSDCYDIVQNIAVFLCEHFGEKLTDYCYTTRNGKMVTIIQHCDRLVERAVCTRYRRLKSDISLEALTRKTEPRVEIAESEVDYTKFDDILSRLNLTEYYETILNCRMAGMSFPEIGRIVGRQISTVWVALNKIRKQYISIMQ